MRGSRKRKIIVYIATSADGFIARRDGSVDWLDRPRPKGNYGIGTFFRSIDSILWGRKTYEFALKHGGSRTGPRIENYVFSHRRLPPKPGWIYVEEPFGPFAEYLRAKEGKDIWIMGGAGLIGSFLDAGQIDEFIINVIPIFIGEGIPLIQPRRRHVALELKSTRRFRDGLVQLRYAVNPKSRSRR